MSRFTEERNATVDYVADRICSRAPQRRNQSINQAEFFRVA